MNITASRLRDVAEAIENNGVRCTHICIGFDFVSIDDAAFEKMFSGCVLAGKRRVGSEYVGVVGEKHGIVWSANLWRPRGQYSVQSSGAERVAVGEVAPAAIVFAIDSE